MHELGHVMLQHQKHTQEEEDEADYFASCILAPRIMIHTINSKIFNSAIVAEDLRDYFDLSISASNRAIMDYHVWFKNIAHTTRRPTDAECNIRSLFFIEIDESSRQRPLDSEIRRFQYLLDTSNTEYLIRQMEHRRLGI